MEELKKELLKFQDEFERLEHVSGYIYKNDLLNIAYHVQKINNEDIAQIVHIGAPIQIVSMLTRMVTIPLKQLEIPVNDTPVLRRVVAEKKSIYFRRLPELVAGLIPQISHQQQIKLALEQMGITDVAVVPIEVKIKGKNKFFMLAVLGPLSDQQKQFIKDCALVFIQSFT